MLKYLPEIVLECQFVVINEILESLAVICQNNKRNKNKYQR